MPIRKSSRIKYVYKVVVVDKDGKMFSTSAPGKYALEYKIGEIVAAKTDTLGIFCFRTKKQAQEFADHIVMGLKSRYTGKRMYILRAIPIGKSMAVKYCCTTSYDETSYDWFYRSIGSHEWSRIIKGTVCYHSIRVISKCD